MIGHRKRSSDANASQELSAHRAVNGELHRRDDYKVKRLSSTIQQSTKQHAAVLVESAQPNYISPAVSSKLAGKNLSEHLSPTQRLNGGWST
jgi:hypothetical protein